MGLSVRVTTAAVRVTAQERARDMGLALHLIAHHVVVKAKQKAQRSESAELFMIEE